jgi:SAM-dependent methyltransferase
MSSQMNIVRRILKATARWLKPRVGADNQETRDGWLEKTLSNLPAGSRILDAGAGTQQYKRFCTHLIYVSQDFAQYDGQGDRSGLQTGSFEYGKLDIISDITSIPEPDGSFDAILCSEVLEHLPDPVLAVKELSRLLTTGGILILTAPFCSLTHFSPYHFSTGFNKYWYEKHLLDHGLKIIELVPNGNYYEYLAQEVNRIPAVAEKYSGIRPNAVEQLAAIVLIRLLYKLSQRDSGSAELLCFGYHVRAQKYGALGRME